MAEQTQDPTAVAEPRHPLPRLAARFMPWSRAKTRALLMGLALCGAAAEAWHLVRTQPDTLVGCAPIATPFREQYITRVALTVKDFHPQGNQFGGALSATVELPAAIELIGPGGQGQNYDGSPYTPPDLKVLQKDFRTMQQTFASTMLQLNHSTGDHSAEEQGGSVEPLAMKQPKLRSSLMGNGTFTWTATATQRPFYYPFDRYVLSVNPELLAESEPDTFLDYAVDQLTVDFSGTGFIPKLEFLGDVKPGLDRFRVIVQRPMLLRVITGVVGALLIVWLLYLMLSPRAGEQAGQVVTLFVGVFSVRNSLLSGAPVFPSLVDYCALGVYLSAVLIVLIRWLVPDQPGRTCPDCCSPVSAHATVCPACTRPLVSDAQIPVGPAAR